MTRADTREPLPPEVKKRGYNGNQWAKAPPPKEVTFLPMFILIPGFKVQEGSEAFEEFIKGQSEGIREIKKVPVTTLK